MLGCGMKYGMQLITPEMKIGMFYIKLFVSVWLIFVTTIIAMKLDRIIKLLGEKKSE